MDTHMEAIMHELRKVRSINGLTMAQRDEALSVENRILIALNNMLRETRRKVKT